MNEIFGIEYSGCDMEGKPILGSRTYPAYSCGHCSRTVVLNEKRSRPRTTCKKCGRWLCESNELCLTDCTPIYDLARDHNTTDPKWGKYLPGILAGAATLEEASNRGLLLKE